MFSLNSSIASMIGIEGHLPRLGLQYADAVVEVFVGARAAAVDTRQQRAAAGKSDARESATSGMKLRPSRGSVSILSPETLNLTEPLGGLQAAAVLRVHVD